MKINHIFSILCLVSMSYYLQASESNVTIERYQSERDKEVVQKILNDNYDYLTYESIGFPEGKTMQYIESKKYITDVLRVNGQTVGFVNYCVHDPHFLTFYLGRQALVHLIGIDKEHQGKGYGTRLLKHAMSALEQLQAPTITLSVKKDNNKGNFGYNIKKYL